MNDIDIIERVFSFLHINSSTNTYKQLCLVNKQFNNEFNNVFKDKIIKDSLSEWFENSARLYFEESTASILKSYFQENNTFRFKVSYERCVNYNNVYDGTLTVNNGHVSFRLVSEDYFKSIYDVEEIPHYESDDDLNFDFENGENQCDCSVSYSFNSVNSLKHLKQLIETCFYTSGFYVNKFAYSTTWLKNGANQNRIQWKSLFFNE